MNGLVRIMENGSMENADVPTQHAKRWQCAAFKFSWSSAKRTRFKSTLRQQEGVEGIAKHTPALNKGSFNLRKKHVIIERAIAIALRQK